MSCVSRATCERRRRRQLHEVRPLARAPLSSASTVAEMLKSGLRTSWATPATSPPMAAMLSLRRSDSWSRSCSAWARFSAVRSRERSRRAFRPSNTMSMLVMSTSRTVPSFRRCCLRPTWTTSGRGSKRVARNSARCGSPGTARSGGAAGRAPRACSRTGPRRPDSRPGTRATRGRTRAWAPGCPRRADGSAPRRRARPPPLPFARSRPARSSPSPRAAPPSSFTRCVVISAQNGVPSRRLRRSSILLAASGLRVAGERTVTLLGIDEEGGRFSGPRCPGPPCSRGCGPGTGWP